VPVTGLNIHRGSLDIRIMIQMGIQAYIPIEKGMPYLLKKYLFYGSFEPVGYEFTWKPAYYGSSRVFE